MTRQPDFGSPPPIPDAQQPPEASTPTPAPPAAPVRQRIPLPNQRPIFSYVFLVINVIVFLAGLALDSAGIQPSLLELGWKDTARIAAGEYWRLVTPLFLHAGPAHIFFNSYAIYIIAPQVERVFGSLRFVVIYLLSGIAGVVASMIFNPNVPSVGASGAIFGLIGALIVYLYRHRELFGGMGRRRLMAALEIAGINLLIGLAPGIDNWGHVGGLVSGVAMTALLGPTLYVKQEYDGSQHVEDRTPIVSRWWAVLLSGGVLLGLTAFAITLYG
jgi:rhomboid protease GluP